MTSLVLFFTNIKIGSITFAQHTLIVTCALTVVGIQSVFFWTFAKSVAIQKRLLFSDKLFKAVRALFGLEKCLLTGGLLVMTGFAMACYGLFYWYPLSFGSVEGDALIRIVCGASVLISTGFQLTFGAFFMVVFDQPTGHGVVGLGHIGRKICRTMLIQQGFSPDRGEKRPCCINTLAANSRPENQRSFSHSRRL